MDRLEFECVEEFIAKVDADYNALTDDYKELSIVCKYDEAVEIIKTLMCFDYNIRSISRLSVPEYDFYADEYVISLTSIDGDRELWCEPMKRENGYIKDEATIAYIMDNCGSQCLAYCSAPLLYEIYIKDECEDCCCDGECLDCNLDECDLCDEYADDVDDKFKCTIKVNLDTKEAEEILEAFEKRFEKMNASFDRIFNMSKLF